MFTNRIVMGHLWHSILTVCFARHRETENYSHIIIFWKQNKDRIKTPARFRIFPILAKSEMKRRQYCESHNDILTTAQ